MRFRVGEEEAAGELHGEGGAAPRCLRSPTRSCHAQLDHADVVDAAVLEEAAVFDGEDGLDEVLRDLVVGDEAALGAVGVFAEAGDEKGFEFVAGERLAVVVGDGVDDAVGDVDGGAVLGVVGLRARA